MRTHPVIRICSATLYYTVVLSVDAACAAHNALPAMCVLGTHVRYTAWMLCFLLREMLAHLCIATRCVLLRSEDTGIYAWYQWCRVGVGSTSERRDFLPKQKLPFLFPILLRARARVGLSAERCEVRA